MRTSDEVSDEILERWPNLELPQQDEIEYYTLTLEYYNLMYEEEKGQHDKLQEFLRESSIGTLHDFADDIDDINMFDACAHINRISRVEKILERLTSGETQV